MAVNKPLKRILQSGLVIAGLISPVYISAAEPPKAEVQYSAKAEIVHVDNLFLSRDNEVDDVYLVFSPGVKVSTAQNSVTSYSVGYTHHFKSYNDNSDQNRDLSDFNSRISYNSGVLLASGYLSYLEQATNTIEVNAEGDQVEWDRTTAGGSLRYELSDLTAVKAGLDYLETDYESNAYVDTESLSVPLTFFYSVRPTIDLTAGTRFRSTDTFSPTRSTFNYEDTFYYVGAVGELFSPKLYGDIKYGYQTREYKNSSRDEASSSYDMSIVYAADPKTSVYLSMSRDYRTSAAGGLAYSLTDVNLGARYDMTRSLHFTGAIAVGNIEYEDSPRSEDIIRFNLGTSYTPNDYLTLRAQYGHTEVDGNNKGGATTYDKNEIRVSASVRY